MSQTQHIPPLTIQYVASRFTWPVKTRLLALATVVLFVAAMTAQSFAVAPAESGAAHKCPMAKGQANSGAHQCNHQRPAMPCCPMPTSQNSAPAPTPAECMARGQCCQLSEDRTRPLRNENRIERSPDSRDNRVATSASDASSASHRSTWRHAGLRFNKPVLELKTDLRI